jgi:hypothetical protein
MNGPKWVPCCAVVGVWFLASSLSAPAQESEEAAGGERSVLAAQPQAGKTGDLCRCVGETDSPSVAKIEQALRSPLTSTGLDFIDTPLEEVVELLQTDYRIPVQLDTPALDEMGLGPEEPITTNLHNISLRSALRLMLKQLGLTYLIRDEVLMITTPEEAEAALLTCVYDATSLVDGTSEKSFDALIDTIVSCIATESWAENGGGEAEIRPLKPGLLVISQTQAVHEEIRDLLAAIQQTRQDRPVAADAASNAADDEPLVTRCYLLNILGKDNFDTLRTELRDLIVKSIPDERWRGKLDNGRPVVLTILPDRIVVRHKESVQAELQELLADSGIAARAGCHTGGGLGGGGLAEPAKD